MHQTSMGSLNSKTEDPTTVDIIPASKIRSHVLLKEKLQKKKKIEELQKHSEEKTKQLHKLLDQNFKKIHESIMNRVKFFIKRDMYSADMILIIACYNKVEKKLFCFIKNNQSYKDILDDYTIEYLKKIYDPQGYKITRKGKDNVLEYARLGCFEDLILSINMDWGIKEFENKDEQIDCCICFEKTEDLLHCGHKVCKDCYRKQKAPSCPICNDS